MDWFLYETDLRHERANNLSSSEKPLEIWKKGQRHLEEFWRVGSINELIKSQDQLRPS